MSARSLAVLLSLAFTMSAAPAWSDETHPMCTQPAAKGEWLQKVLSRSAIKPNRDTLQSVAARLGPAVVRHTGDAGAALSSVCYRLSGTRWLVAEASEIGGRKDVTLVRLTQQKPLEACAGLKDPLLEPIIGGLRIGTSFDDIVKLVGRCHCPAPERCEVTGTAKRTINTREHDVTTKVAIQFTEGRASTVELTQVITN